jgi:hypothetical protein
MVAAVDVNTAKLDRHASGSRTIHCAATLNLYRLGAATERDRGIAVGTNGQALAGLDE